MEIFKKITRKYFSLITVLLMLLTIPTGLAFDAGAEAEEASQAATTIEETTEIATTVEVSNQEETTQESTTSQESTTEEASKSHEEETQPQTTPDDDKDQEEDDQGYTTVHLDFSQIEDSILTVYDLIQEEMLKAREIGTPEKPYKIVLPQGTYPLDGTLNIYSNTFLEMEGTTLVRNYSKKACMLKTGKQYETNKGYEGYGNITIHGGTFDGWDNTSDPCVSNLTRFGHCRNILIDNVSFTDDHNSHYIELAACKDVTIKNCSFNNQYFVYDPTANKEKSFSEVIQIDALEENSFPLYDEYDGTACKDITIEGCTFTNVSRGIGSHAVILSDTGYYSGINIFNNTFTNIYDYPILSLCWIDSTIANNSISDCDKGILIRSIRSDFERMYDGELTSIPENHNVLISNNTVTTKENCIRLYGVELLADYSWETLDGSKGTTPAGDYTISGITVTDNTLQSDACAVKCVHTENSLIKNNNISLTCQETTATGINLINDSHSNKIESNTIVSAGKKDIKAGVLISGSCPDNIISKNKISGPFLKSIFLYSGADNTTVINNNTADSSEVGIYVYGCRNAVVTDNTVKPKSGYGIYFKNQSSGDNIATNKITVPNAGTGVGVDGSTVTKITNNTATGGDKGVYANNATINKIESNQCKSNELGVYIKNSTAKNVNTNDVNSPNGYGIRFNSVVGKNILGNSINKAGKYGIYMASSSGKIDNNTIKGSGSGGMYFDKDSQNTIYTNIFSSNKTADIIMENSASTIKSSNITFPAKINIQSVAYDKINISWSSVSNATIYRIYRSTDDVSYTLIGSVSSKYTSYTDTSLESDKNYYYKIRPIASGSKAVVYGSYSAVGSKKITPFTAVTAIDKQSYSDRIVLSWSSTFEPKEYNIYKKEKSDKNYTLIKTLSGVTSKYTDTDIVPGKTYYYKVKQVCYNNNNEAILGDYSNTSSIVPKVQSTSIKSLLPTDSNKARITVKNKSGDTGYQVLYSTEKTKNFKVVKTLKAASKVFECDIKLTKNKPAYFKVRAYYTKCGKTYYSSYSDVKKLTVTAPNAKIKSLKKILVPQVINGQRVKVTKAELKWEKVEESIKGYQVYCKINNGKYQEVKTVNNKTFKHISIPLQKGYVYKYKVRTVKIFNGKTYYGAFTKEKTIKA